MAITTYITSADVQGLGSEFTIPSAYDAGEVTKIIYRAMAVIDKFTRSHWLPETRSFVVDGTGNNFLYLRSYTSWPVCTISSVQFRVGYAATDDFTANGETLDATTYAVHASKRALIKVKSQDVRAAGGFTDPIWLKGTQNYKLTGTFGHNAVPEDLKRATVYLAREWMLPGSTTQFVSMSSESFPDGYSYQAGTSNKSTTVEVSFTGYRAVDILLGPYVSRVPILGVV
mgnify:CR=1 FL=1